MLSFNTLPQESKNILESIPAIINKTFPIPGRFRSRLPSQVAELSRLLTGGRNDRAVSYLNRPNLLAAYLHYFLPWNIYRLCLILPNLNLTLSAGDTIVDLGCGPLTFTAALWISRPDLRKLPLKFYCIDQCAPVLEAGKKFFAALTGSSPGSHQLWKIHSVRKTIDIRARAGRNRSGKPANNNFRGALVCTINMFNELYEYLPHSDSKGLERIAENAVSIMNGYALPSASILTVEPGIPHSGHFISLLRAAFIKSGSSPLSPCPHLEACPLPGGLAGKNRAKKRWCHFSFTVNKDLHLPKDLHRLSAAAGLPKERLVLSYLLTGSGAANAPQRKTPKNSMRVISDAFPLPDNRYGRYGCSAQGLILLTGEKRQIENTVSGSLVNYNTELKPLFDEKSGSLIARLAADKEQTK